MISTERGAAQLDLGQASDVGRVRDTNEDSVVALPRGAEGDRPRIYHTLLAVADGMGGHNAGEVASHIAIQALQEFLYDQELQSPEALVRQAMEWANRCVWQAARDDAGQHGMGTTLVCALVSREAVAVLGNVGDSRAYLVSGGRGRLLTADHSWVEEQVRDGRMSASEAETSPYRHVLTRSLGVVASVEIDVYPDVRLQVGDTLVLCSDGVSMYLREGDLERVVGDAETAQEAAEELVRLALRRGGADNASVVVARRVA